MGMTATDCGGVVNNSTLQGCANQTGEWAFFMVLLALGLIYAAALLVLLLRR